MFFCCSRIPSTLHLVVSLGYSWLWQFLWSSFFLLTLTVLRSANQVYDWVLLCWNLSDLFLWLDQIYKGFWEVDHRGKVPFSSHHSRVHSIFCLLILMTWLKQHFSGLSGKVFLVVFRLSILYSSDRELWLSCHCAQPLLEWGVTLLLGWNSYIIYLEFFCMGDFFFCIYSIIYLYGLLDMDSWIFFFFTTVNLLLVIYMPGSSITKNKTAISTWKRPLSFHLPFCFSRNSVDPHRWRQLYWQQVLGGEKYQSGGKKAIGISLPNTKISASNYYTNCQFHI